MLVLYHTRKVAELGLDSILAVKLGEATTWAEWLNRRIEISRSSA